jgi:hypothetical protein
LRPRREVHPVPVQRPVLLAHVSQVDPDAEAHGAVLGKRGVAPRELALDVDRGGDGLDRAGKLRQQVIALRVHHATVVRGDVLREDLAVGRERGDGRLLVVAHQPRVADDIGAQDGCELPSLRHGLAPGRSRAVCRRANGVVTILARERHQAVSAPKELGVARDLELTLAESARGQLAGLSVGALVRRPV